MQATIEPLTRPPDALDRLSRRELLTLISALMGLTAVSIDLMLPAFDDIRQHFDLADGSADVGKIITVFFIGLALGQLVYGPLADRFGRKRTLYAGIAVFLLGAVGSAVAPTFGLLLLSRFVWGVGAAGSRVVAVAIVRDRFEGEAMAAAMSQIMAVFVLVPILAPAIGSAVIAIMPWRGIFWLSAVCAAIVALWGTRLSETLDPANRRPLSLKATKQGFAQVVRTPITFGYTMSSVFLQGVFTTYLASSEVIISDIFDRRDQFPIVFGGVAVLFGLAALINGRVVGQLGIERVVTLVLRSILPLCAVLVACAAAGNGTPNFWLFMPTLGLVLAGFMFLLPNLNSAAMGPVGEIAGTASALTGAARIAGGAVLGGVATNMIDESITPFAISVAAMCSCAAACVWLVRRGVARRDLGLAQPIASAMRSSGSPST